MRAHCFDDETTLVDEELGCFAATTSSIDLTLQTTPCLVVQLSGGQLHSVSVPLSTQVV